MGLFKKNIIGIDISCSQLRFVEISGSSHAPILKNVGHLYLDEDIVNSGKIVNQEKFKAALEDMWKKNKIKSNDIVLGVSNNDIIMRFITLPQMPPEKMANLVKFQASDYMPINIEEFELDHAIVGENINQSGSYYNVLLVAARKKMLYEFISAFNEINLNIKDIKSSVLVMDKLVPEENLKNVSVMVNISSETCNLLIVSNNMPAFARAVLLKEKMYKEIDIIQKKTYSINEGVDNIQKETVNSKISTISSQEKNKSNSGGIAVMENIDSYNIDSYNVNLHNYEYNNYIEAVQRVVNFIGDEIRTSISYFNSQNRNLIIEKIFLLGCVSGNKVIYEGLVNYLGINVEILKPYESLFNDLSQKTKDEKYRPNEYAIALSLALHGLED